ncbi:DUF3060 domain-containing protein [Hyalangium sp.]|uniref:DUF3060 domain-containing protein n=1 Tax=Hyalangium sp. TaxID=2028555 RepID=UPI002D60D13F|nr:DUF3060 domain-containing protein [Hyalangium sp.]HYH97659.1 DUF3060 domain-containing protein [Hyalangium sp.]
MSKGIRSAVIALTVCFAMAAGAQGTVKVGKDGSVKINSGGSKVDVSGGNVKVESDGTTTQVEVEKDDDEERSDDDSDSEINITDAGRKATLACDGNTEVSISGSANDLTFTGECKRVDVTGSSNKVTLDTVGRIDVTGTSNAVTWKKAAGGKKKPKVSSTGTANKISQAK